MTHVFHRHTAARLPVAVGGDGAYVIDKDGKRYLDASGGAAVSCLGHADKTVVAAIKDQLDKLPYAHTGFFTTDVLEDLADRMVADAPDGLDRIYFVSGGSEAMEAALKLARQYFVEIGQPERRHLIARRQSYHGNTLGALATGGNAWRRAQFEPMLIEVERVGPCYPYREQHEGESDTQYVARLAAELEDTVQRLGPRNVAAFVAETVVGATAGVLVPLPGYHRAMKRVCDAHGILYILDEVMCGMGRTGTLHACEQDGVAPDLMAVAKGLGAGYQPIGATYVHGRLFQAIADGSGFFQHGHTYMGHPAACAAALAVQSEIRRRDLLANVRDKGAKLRAALDAAFGQHRAVGDIRGRGLFLGLELVADRRTKAPFDPALGLAKTIKAAAMARGLMCYPMGGTVDGRQGDHILLAPPFILTDDQVGEIVDKLAGALDDALTVAAP